MNQRTFFGNTEILPSAISSGAILGKVDEILSRLNLKRVRILSVNLASVSYLICNTIMASSSNVENRFTQQTYGAREANFKNATAKALLRIIDRKQTNLCVSVDVTRKRDVLAIVDAVGKDVALIKVSGLMRQFMAFSHCKRRT